MTTFLEARDQVLDVLRRELVGPDPQGGPFDPQADELVPDTAWMPRRQAGTGEEILVRDSPDRRYGIGVLYSSGGRARGSHEVAAGEAPVEPPSDSEPELATDQFQADASEALEELSGELPSQDLDLSGANDFRPTTMAVTFLAELRHDTTVDFSLTAGRYQQRDVTVGTQSRSWWFRSSASLACAWNAKDLLSRPGHYVGKPEMNNLDGLDIRVFAVSRPRDDGTSLLTVGVMNATPGATPNHFLFQLAFAVSVRNADGSGLILPYPQAGQLLQDPEEQSIDLLYREHPTFAIGHGCAAGWDRSFTGALNTCAEVRAECLPSVQTPSITPEVTRADGSEVRVSMAPLAGLVEGNDGFASVAEVIELYERWISDREAELASLSADHQTTGQRHLDSCRQVVSRMRAGLQLVTQSGDVRDAFVLANRAVLMQQVHSVGTTRELLYDDRAKAVRHAEPRRVADPLSPPPDRGAWRPFQIAFILAALPSTADREHADRELVDLIFFPTGGGKTEAYLGLTAFSVFLRRLRDPQDIGVEVLMRYTLRLLTAQQFQRAGALVCAMERIRLADARLGTHPFSIGIWVGGDTAPNTRKQAVNDLKNLRAGRGSNPFLVIRCPWCAAQIGPLREQQAKRKTSKGPRVLGYNEANGTVRISCTDADCDFTELPLVVIDEDIYDRKPDIVIGTVDKFAQLAWRSDARALFGLGDDGTHTVSPPGLVIQDELHLISGPLGSMVGLYETVIEELCTDLRSGSPKRPKIVTSTATIRRYEEQVSALFARDRVALFPPHGLEAGDSFFARHARYSTGHERAGELREGQMYVGVHGAGLGSLQTAQVRAFSALLQAGMDLSEAQRDPYWTLMVFFNSLRELGTSLSLLQSDIPDYMKVVKNRRGSSWEDVRRLTRELELTGRLQNDDVPAVMQALELPYGAGKDVVDVCLASNIIEVGIDIDRLSLMTVVGQPKTTSQYIQVTGRVGRRWQERPGLVVTIYGATKPRDRSHYEKFRTYHQRLYAQVEPTSVTPFAPPVLSRALHAVIVAWVRQRIRTSSAATPYPVPADLIQEVATVLRRRVAFVDPDEAAALERFLDLRIQEWQRWLPGEWRRGGASAEPGLLYPAGDYADPEERVRSWATPTSLRNVDAECRGVVTGIYALAEDAPA